jgi:hypothetical protein
MPLNMTSESARRELANARPQLYRIVENEPGIRMDRLMEITQARFGAPIIRTAITELISEGEFELRSPGNQLYVTSEHCK